MDRHLQRGPKMFSSFLSLFFFECANEQLVIICVSICTWRPETDAMCASLLLSTGFWRRGLSLWTAELVILARLADYQVLGFICSITQGWDCMRASLGLTFLHPIDRYSNPIHTQQALYLRNHILSPTCFPPLKKKGKLGKEDWACSPGLN